MSRKFSAARRAAFLRALVETGNQTLAAERAKVSRSWVRMTRTAEPDFDAAVQASIAEARERLLRRPSQRGNGETESDPSTGSGRMESAEDGPKPSRRALDAPGFQHGVELVTRGSNGRRVQIARARVKEWTPRLERRFLETLAATCNVKAACAAAGLTAASAYNRRQRSEAFQRAWDEALAIGYDKIEAALLEAATASLDGLEFSPDAPIPPMSAWDAMHLLRFNRRALRGPDTRAEAQAPRVSLEDPRILAVIERRTRLFAQRMQRERGQSPDHVARPSPAPRAIAETAAGRGEEGPCAPLLATSSPAR